MPQSGPWTGDIVAERLVEAFRLLPSHPVFSRNGRFGMVGVAGAGEVLGWPNRFVADEWSRRVLLTWARCMATGDSVRERYRGLGWARSLAERRRREALDQITIGLNAGLIIGPNAIDP